MNHYLILRTQKMVIVCDGLCDGGRNDFSPYTRTTYDAEGYVTLDKRKLGSEK